MNMTWIILLGFALMSALPIFLPRIISRNALKNEMQNNIKKERHGFLTFWFIFWLVLSIIFVMYYGAIFGNPDSLNIMEITKEVAVLNMVIMFVYFVSYVLLLNWKILGFILLCILSLVQIIINPVPHVIVVWIIGPILDFVLLQIKKNGISAWTHLTGNYSKNNKSDNIINNIENNILDEYKKCFFCAESIKKEAIICRFCGKSVNNNS